MRDGMSSRHGGMTYVRKVNYYVQIYCTFYQQYPGHYSVCARVLYSVLTLSPRATARRIK